MGRITITGRQPYTNGDVTAPGRDSTTFSKEVLPIILSLRGNPNSSVLDIGCGNGRMIKCLLPYYPNITGIEPCKKDYDIEPNIEKYIEDTHLDGYNYFYAFQQDKPKHDIVLMNSFAYLFNENPSELVEILDQITNKNALYIISGDPNNTMNAHEYFKERFKLERYIEINSGYFYGIYTKK